MMEVKYRREMNRNYMILLPMTERADKYTIHMMAANRIPGLLPFQEKWINGESWYYYDVTSKQPLSRILEYRNMQGKELKVFLSSLIFSIEQMGRFLLDENQICLNPDYIYTEPETFQTALALIPGKQEDFVQGFQELAQYLLDHVDSNDRDAVVMAFTVFKESRKMNFGMADIENCLVNLNLEKKAEMISDVKEELKGAEEVKKVKSEIPSSEGDTLYQNQAENEDSGGRTDIRKVLIGGVMILIPIFVSGTFGIAGLNRWKWYIGGVELILVFAFLYGSNIIKKMDTRENKETEAEIFWEDYLQEGETFETELSYEGETHSGEEMQTILLTSHPGVDKSRFLIPKDGGERIAVSYFPFLIGKSEGIVDLYLDKPEVSRLHAKIEEKDGIYQVTDLNSKNGTKVDGRLLNANETCTLYIGSELTFASERFLFQ